MVNIVKRYWYYIAIILLFLAVVSLVLIIVFVYEKDKDNMISDSNLAIVEPIIDNNEEKEEEDIKTFFVEIKGYVKKPGVYEVNDKMIINDVIKQSGGLKSYAYTNNINLSKKLVPEMVIYVYSKTEYNKLTEVKPVETCNCPTYDIKECVDDGNSTIVVGEPSPVDNENKLININTASSEELQTISGIGESKANSIITYRETNGLFKSIEDIKNVSGIGDSIYNTIKESITV